MRKSKVRVQKSEIPVQKRKRSAYCGTADILMDALDELRALRKKRVPDSASSRENRETKS